MSTDDKIIALESYAAVIAGLGAGLPLVRALEHANVGVFEWNVGEEHWRGRIDESAATDLSLLVAFDAALISAKRRFEPTVEPIESDVRAWAHFRRHFVTAVDPVGFLAKCGMYLSTYARIEGDWANRVLSDEALAAKLQKHMAEPLEACPSITLRKSALLVSRNIPIEDQGPPPAPKHAMHAIAQENSFLGDAMSRAAASPPVVVNTPEVTPASHVDDPAATTQFLTMQPITAPALPFNPHAAPTEPQPKPESPHIADMDPGQTMDWSLVASNLNKRVTPFESTSPNKPTDAIADVTQFVTVNPTHRGALPFVPSAPSALLPIETKDQPIALESNIGHAAATATEDQLGSTMMFDSSQLLAAATPFEKPNQAAPPAGRQDAQAPMGFTLERYASICVEFILAPTQAKETAARYGVNPEQWANVDAYWRGRMTKEPDVRAAWEKACIAYRQWLLKR